MNSKFSLFLYQDKAVQWMNSKNNGIIFAEMGLGKSLITLNYLSSKKGPHLIICGKTLIGSWLHEIEKFCDPKPKVFIFHKEFNKNLDVDLKSYNIVLTTYDKVVSGNKTGKNKFSDYFFFKEAVGNKEMYKIKNHENRLNRQELFGVLWETIICDECQMVSNWKTARYQSIYSLPSKKIFGLSGTPIKNNKMELLGLCKLLKIKNYNYPSQWKKSDIESFLFDSFYTITYSTAGVILPPISEISYELDFSDDTVLTIDNYISMWNDYSKTTYNEFEKMSKLMSLFVRLRQIAIDPCLIGLTDNGTKQYIEVNRTIPPNFGSEKFDKLLDIVSEKENERFILFSFFTSYLELIEEKLGRETFFVKSNYSIKQRFEIIDEWKKSDNGILMMNYKLGAEGLNLTEATQIVLIDSWYNFSCESQAIARAHRIGQTKEVTVHRLVYKSSIEIIMYRKCREKLNLFYKLKNREEIKQRGSVISYDNMSKCLLALQGDIASVILERELDQDEIEYMRKVYKELYMIRDKNLKLNILSYLVEHSQKKINSFF